MRQINKFNFGKSSQERLSTVSNYLQLTAARVLQCSPVDFAIPWMGGLREFSEQKEIFDMGNSKCDGAINISYHQATDAEGKGLALDVAPYASGISYEAYGRFGIIGMLMLQAWEDLQGEGLIPKNLYIHWGGLWSHKDPKDIGWDPAHYEIRDYEQKINV